MSNAGAYEGIESVRALLRAMERFQRPPPHMAVELALTMAVTLLSAAADDTACGRSDRWRAAVERLALQADGLRTGEGA